MRFRDDYYRDVDFHSMLEVLDHWARLQPERMAYTMLDSKGAEDSNIDYANLQSKAINVAQVLLSQGLQSKVAILVYPPGIEFIIGFFGCLYAGVVPAPIHPPKQNRPNQKIANLVSVTNAAAILLRAEDEQSFCRVLMKEENWPNNILYLATDTIVTAPMTEKATLTLPQIEPSNLAFLQFTSGSTSLPKGVMISHANCLNNLKMAVSVSQSTPASTFVSWLPHHHDLGLVAHLLHSLYNGSHCVILAPATFVSYPTRWLQAITQYRAEYTGAPNFAYQLCIDKIQSSDLQNLDLSSLRMAINAAEPVNPETLRNFSQKFAKSGFKPHMFLPAYGMAEATVFISAGLLEQEPVFKIVDSIALRQEKIAINVTNGCEEKVLVGCGHAKLDEKIRIVDPEHNCVLPTNHVGEIWISGTNVTSGYYHNPAATAKTIVSLVNEKSTYLRTGDLGFFDEDGELFITGRLKDMIIVDGENYYPQDIESCIGKAHSDIRADCVTAFSISDQKGEELVVFIELTRHGISKLDRLGYLEELANTICIAFGELFNIRLNQLVFLGSGKTPKTSSGKLRRQQCKLDFLSGYLNSLATWSQDKVDNQPKEEADMSNVEKTLEIMMSMGSEHLGVFTTLMDVLTSVNQIHLADFNIEKTVIVDEIGFDKVVEVHSLLEKQLGFTIPAEKFLQKNTFMEMIDEIVVSISK